MILTCLFKYLNLSKQKKKPTFFIGRESKCEQEEDNGSKHENKRSVNENLHSDESKNSRSKNQLTKYKRVDKARNYPGSMLRPYSSVNTIGTQIMVGQTVTKDDAKLFVNPMMYMTMHFQKS